MRNETHVTFKDLDSLVISCRRCLCEVSLHLDDQQRSQVFTPSECPACKEPFNVPAKSLDDFRQLCREFSHLGQVALRIKETPAGNR